MPKLPVLTSKKVLTILQKNGFESDHMTGSHYSLYNQKTKRRVTVPFHTKDLPKGTLLSIMRMAGISREDFS
ncbi:MAG: type II toxin-antitoxin system HicA family toxin [Candidatus Taylorbacteria bacterium]|nr:type II toxin-antitoxin system HicA family toxin [Candidatus Taylorbacteria bacterium]